MDFIVFVEKDENSNFQKIRWKWKATLLLEREGFWRTAESNAHQIFISKRHPLTIWTFFVQTSENLEDGWTRKMNRLAPLQQQCYHPLANNSAASNSTLFSSSVFARFRGGWPPFISLNDPERSNFCNYYSLNLPFLVSMTNPNNSQTHIYVYRQKIYPKKNVSGEKLEDLWFWAEG